MPWDPTQYGKFASERERPFYDLLSRVQAEDPSEVADLGCGSGKLTAILSERWPRARVTGVDDSEEMLAGARAVAEGGRLEFTCADLAAWTPPARVDVVFSNAALQWVPDHERLIPRLASCVARDGWLAFQVPGNFDAPSHALLRDTLRAHGRADLVRAAPVLDPAEYASMLGGLGFAVEAWETTYLHLLPGEDAVLEWVKGTALRPALSALAGAARDAFVADYASALRKAYPRGPHGTPFPFRRIFVAARRASGV